MNALNYRDRAIEVPYTVFPTESNSVMSDNDDGMGSWLSDALGINIDVISAAQQLLNAIGQVIQNIANAIKNINWTQLGQNIGMVIQDVANLELQLNPAYLLYQGLSTNPLTGHAFQQLDQLTGGLITDVTNIQTLPLRVLAGQPITSTECLRDGLLALKVVAIVLTVGIAAAPLSVLENGLAQGTLAQTPLGAAVLAVATAGIGAAITNGEIGTAVETSATQVGVTAGATQAIKSTPLGQTSLGAIAIAALGAAAGGAATGLETGADVGTSSLSSLQSFGKSTAISQGAKVVPGGGIVSGFLVNQALANASTATISSVADIVSSAPGAIVNAISNLPQTIAQGISNIPSAIAQIPSLISQAPGQIAQAIANIQTPSLPSISVPSFSSITISPPEVNVGQILPLIINGVRKPVASRTKKVVNGTPSYVYTFTDGTQTTVAISMSQYFPYLAAGFLVFAVAAKES